MKPLSELIESTPAVLKGTLVFTGTRVPITNLFSFIRKGKTLRHFVTHYPLVDINDAVMVLRHAGLATVGFEKQIDCDLKHFPMDELFTFITMNASVTDFLALQPKSTLVQVQSVLDWAEKTVIGK